jgi:hypothetical protein
MRSKPEHRVSIGLSVLGTQSSNILVLQTCYFTLPYLRKRMDGHAKRQTYKEANDQTSEMYVLVRKKKCLCWSTSALL